MTMQRTQSILLIAVLLFTLAACGGKKDAAAEQVATPAPELSGDPAEGQRIFATACASCHGPAGEGITGLGKDMTQSEFIAERSNAELVEFIKVGRTPDDPLNTTGVAMPPKGGNPALNEQQLADIVAYIRSLHETK